MSDDGVNYTQNNSQANSTNATLRLPPYAANYLKVRVTCNVPKASGGSAILSPNNAWSFDAGSNKTDMAFNSTNPINSSTSQTAANLSANGTFVASYYNSGSTWLANITMGWRNESTGKTLFVANLLNSSAGMVPSDINCAWNATVNLTYAAAPPPLRIHVPVTATASYGNASYFGNLTVLSS